MWWGLNTAVELIGWLIWGSKHSVIVSTWGLCWRFVRQFSVFNEKCYSSTLWTISHISKCLRFSVPPWCFVGFSPHGSLHYYITYAFSVSAAIWLLDAAVRHVFYVFHMLGHHFAWQNRFGECFRKLNATLMWLIYLSLIKSDVLQVLSVHPHCQWSAQTKVLI